MQRVLQKLKYSVFHLVRVLSLSESNKLNGELASAKVSKRERESNFLQHPLYSNELNPENVNYNNGNC